MNITIISVGKLKEKYLKMVDFSWNQITYTNGGKSACVNSINDFIQIIKITKSFMNIQLENNPILLLPPPTHATNALGSFLSN